MKKFITATSVAFLLLLGPSLNAQILKKAPAWSSFESFTFAEDLEHKTNSLLVMVDGAIVFERYRTGFSSTTPQQIWSITKSITGLIIGKAISDNILKPNELIHKYYPQAPKTITINHLLNMTSGYEWNEGYEYNPLNSDVIRMLYSSNYDDMATFAANKKLAYDPGEYFQYSSGTSNILMGILSKAMGPGDYVSYPWRSFFDPLEIKDATWERDHKGTFVASSYLYLKARDVAKIGQLFLDKGIYKGKQIIPASWLVESATPHPYFLKADRELEQSEYFAYSKQWWLNTALPFPDGSYKSRYPELPANAVVGLGHWGQMLVILPDQKVVIVRTGQDKGKRMNRHEFFGQFMRAYRQAYP